MLTQEKTLSQPAFCGWTGYNWLVAVAKCGAIADTSFHRLLSQPSSPGPQRLESLGFFSAYRSSKTHGPNRTDWINPSGLIYVQKSRSVDTARGALKLH